MATLLVLGAGMVGSAMAIDLAKQHHVILADLEISVLKQAKEKCPALTITTLDVTDSVALAEAVEIPDLVLCAVPGFLGFETLRQLILNKKNVVDISFFEENALELDALAKENGVTAIVDCGVAPGMGNILLGHHNEQLKISEFECFVGGLPLVKQWPFQYKAPFSPIDVLEEYTRPARYVEHGNIITRPALSDCEYLDFEGIGTLEAFNTDGLRSLLFTMSHIPNLKEKTLRYPNHVEYIKVLQASGFFGQEALKIKDQSIRPIDFTARILFDNWKLYPEEEELTVMRIYIKGENAQGLTEEITYNLLDVYSKATQTSSMARTTGYTATAAVNAFLTGLVPDKGILPPELIGRYIPCFEFIVNYLKERNIHYKKTQKVS
ncbi:MAG: saccharopine dehydrogenase family protein [Aureispira sp.]